MVMDHEQQRARYLAGAEGAPPVPPPGGYRGAGRFATASDLPAPSLMPTEDAKQPAGALGWGALISAILFTMVLFGALIAGGTDLFYSVTMIVLQLVVVGIVIAAIFSPRARMLGAIALVLTVLFNVATVGGMSALRSSAAGDYEGVKTAEQKHEEAFPGIKGTDSEQVLRQQSLEEVRAAADALFADIRERLSDEFGYTWVQVGAEDLRPERNGYGGESMLYEYMSSGWATNEPIQDHARKLEVMAVIDDAVIDHGLWSLYSFNDPANSGIDPTMIAKMYGSDDPRTQHTWEYYTENYPEPLRFYANIFDLSNDPTGSFLATREAQSARTGEPLEGLQLFVVGSQVLSEADRSAFEEKLKDYPGFG